MAPRLVNLSPHESTILVGGRRLVLPPSGRLARVVVRRRLVEEIEVDGVPVRIERPVIVGVEGLPDPEPGVLYVASRTIVDLARRDDVVRVDDKVRDGRDRIVGARNLATYPELPP